ncbi:MAG TPA: PEP-CTERM sorting domain-containing protein [Gemmataceae bacterium]|nr:PEP-CTERM sorting domain-containing protein [Gemmataceae bacterium]
MRISFFRLSSVLVLGLLWGGAAHAGYMNWSYHWSISPAPVFASGTGTVSQALGPGGKGASRILAAAVTTSSSASAKDPDHFNKYFSLTLHITDLATHKTGSLTFNGHITGTLTATSTHLTETFRTPLEHVRLGNHVYWVDLPSSLRLAAPGASWIPAYYASVWVQNVSPPPKTTWHPMAASIAMVREASVVADAPGAGSAPEPSSLILGGLGVALAGCAAVRRRLASFKA